MDGCPLADECERYDRDPQGTGCIHFKDRSGVPWCQEFETEVMNQPVAVGMELELDITDQRADGRGVGHIDGYAILVDGAMEGYRTTVTIQEVNKRFAAAEAEGLGEPIPEDDEDEDERGRGRSGSVGRRDDFWG